MKCKRSMRSMSHKTIRNALCVDVGVGGKQETGNMQAIKSRRNIYAETYRVHAARTS